MLIASTAMFFAVAGSAFVVRARMAGHCCDRTHPTHEVRPIAPLVTGSSTPCGEAIYRANPDGTVSVDFRLCPPEEVDGQASSPGAGPGNASSASRAAPPPGS